MISRNLKRIALASVCAVGLTLRADTQKVNSKNVEQRVNSLVDKMTLDEKLNMIHGGGFSINGVKRLGIPSINMSDASMGLRVTPWPHDKGLEPSTAFPSSIMLTATWNPERAYDTAKAISEEFKARNMHVLLGPGVNIYRYPLCGRNYEYMGEDPYLASKMVVPYIKGATDTGVMTVVKHFVANNSDTKRKNSNSVVSERALREIYFPAFKAAVVEAKVPAVMNAYNLLNGEYCGEDSWLLKKVLRGEWGFDGMVISDWDSIWNSDRAANSGLDIEMPGAGQTQIMSAPVMKQLLKDGKVTMDEINSKVKHLIRPCIQFGFYDKTFKDPSLNKREEHAKVALETAREGIVLLENKDNFLPLEDFTNKKIVVLGPTAKKTPTTGGGSGGVTPENPVSIYEGIHKQYPQAELLETFDKQKIEDADAVIVCVGLNESLKLKDYSKQNKKSSIAEEQAGFNRKDLPIEGEGRNRTTYSLPEHHNKLILDCAAINPNIVVMVTAGGGVDMTQWINKVKSVLWLFYPGANGCTAAGEIVSGKVNPSGKLPISIEKKIEDNPAYVNGEIGWGAKLTKKCGKRSYADVNYKEGIFVGYRYYDKNNVEPLFCFGHGLSYTTFTYGKPKVTKNGDKVQVTFTVKNTGTRYGAEIAQLYVRDVQSSVPRPLKELKGFKKVFLKPGETKEVSLTLDKHAFSFWNPKTKSWTLEPGTFELLIGSSSRDIRQRVSVEL